jgi:hypothetical protein
VGKSGNQKLCNVDLSKIENLGTNVDLALFFLNHMVDPMANFLNVVFLITSPQKKYRHDLKMSCIDASRRQLRFVLQIGV